MKIMLINPTIQGDFNTLHLGLTAIASYIEHKTKHNAKIVDLAFRRKYWEKYLEKEVEKFKPDIFAITLSTPLLIYGKTVMKKLNEFNIPILAGGRHVELNPEEVLNFDNVSFISLGEGEEATEELLDKLENKESIKGIKGIWGKENSTLIRNERRIVQKDLCKYPFLDWELYNDFEEQLYFFEYLPLIGTRGCPHNCTFCSAPSVREQFDGHWYRSKDPIAVANEAKYQWEKYKNKGLKFLRFSESIFTGHSLAWINKFKEEYIKEGMKGVPFSIYSRADDLIEEKIKSLSKIGLKVVRVGFESVDDFTLNNIYKKNLNVSEMINGVKICKKYGVEIIGYFILGGPCETWANLEKTKEFILKNDIELPAVLLFKPIPGTKIINKIKKGTCKIEQNWDKTDNMYETAFLTSEEVSAKEVETFHKKLYTIIAIRRLIKEIKYRKLGLILNFPKYLIKGIKYGIPFAVLMRSYLSRRHLK